MKNLILCIHNHQPVGNFKEVFFKAIYHSYLPFLEELLNFPTIKVSLHTSGCLYEFMEDNNINDYFDIVKTLLGRKQIEIVSSGIYEPLLFLLPDKDKIEAIKKMNSYIQNKFNFSPKGIWLTERVWEPHLAKPINQAGIEYTLIDDYAFRKTGLTENDLFFYYVTEEEGYTLKVFPILKKLRYLIPYHEPSEIIDFLENTPEESTIFTYGDDGEKFGLWPGTYDHVYKQGWLKKFLKVMSEHPEYQTLLLEEAVTLIPPKGRIYLSPSSYEEMEEWALNPEDNLKFRKRKEIIEESEKYSLRGGFFRHFMVKYSEANKMHKRMLFAESRVNKKDDSAYTHYLRSQCNCAYWHGIFGGLYLPHLREAIYQEFILADKSKGRATGWTIQDFDKDGQDEMIFSNNRYILFFHKCGGRVLEWDDLLWNKNLTNVMTRYKEAYHLEMIQGNINLQNDNSTKTIHDGLVIKDRSILNYLHFDSYTKECFLDHFFDSIENLKNSVPNLSLYTVKACGGNSLLLENSQGLKKKFEIKDNQVSIHLEVQGISNFYACELNLSLSENGFSKNLSGNEISYNQDGFSLLIKSDNVESVYYEPLFSISNSESGIEKIYQGMTIYLVFPLERNALNKINILWES